MGGFTTRYAWVYSVFCTSCINNKEYYWVINTNTKEIKKMSMTATKTVLLLLRKYTLK
jgi:hypothetical protein